MMRPSISIVIPVFNRERYVRQSVLSALHENIPGSEVIVIDDGSTDNSVQQLHDLPVRLHRCSHGGAATARNRGLELCRGKYIAFLDSDDLLLRNGLRWRLDFLSCNRKEPGVGGTIVQLIDYEGNRLENLERTLYPPDRYGRHATWDEYKQGTRYPPILWSYLFRADFLARVGFFDESLRVAEDVDYFIRVLKSGSPALRRKPVVAHRLHSDNASRQFDPDTLTVTEREKARVQRGLIRLGHGLDFS